MIVGQHIALTGIDNNAGSQALRDAFARGIRYIEKAAEKRVIHQGAADAYPRLRIYIHHRWSHLLQYRRQRWQGFAINGSRNSGQSRACRGQSESHH